MDDRKKTVGMLVLTCLLLLFAAVRFLSMAADWRERDEINRRTSPIQQQIVSNIGPRRMDPFQELGLSAEQRRKIDDILSASLPRTPPPGEDGGPGPHNVKFAIPMDKIRAVLTPDQQRKFDGLHNQHGMPGKMLSGAPPVPDLSAGRPPAESGGMIFLGRRAH